MGSLFSVLVVVVDKHWLGDCDGVDGCDFAIVGGGCDCAINVGGCDYENAHGGCEDAGGFGWFLEKEPLQLCS